MVGDFGIEPASIEPIAFSLCATSSRFADQEALGVVIRDQEWGGIMVTAVTNQPSHAA